MAGQRGKTRKKTKEFWARNLKGTDSKKVGDHYARKESQARTAACVVGGEQMRLGQPNNKGEGRIIITRWTRRRTWKEIGYERLDDGNKLGNQQGERWMEIKKNRLRGKKERGGEIIRRMIKLGSS